MNRELLVQPKEDTGLSLRSELAITCSSQIISCMPTFVVQPQLIMLVMWTTSLRWDAFISRPIMDPGPGKCKTICTFSLYRNRITSVIFTYDEHTQ
jgi:hypothetical protein